MMTLQQAQSMLPSARLIGDGRERFTRVHSDTRSIEAGDLFVALKGDRFDANEFLSEAKAKGAAAALANRGLAEAGLSGLEVADTKLALGQLAAAWRAQFDLPLIAVTGSNGKTTVTQMIASVLRTWCADKAFATVGNLNNDIGLPLTLLKLRSSHRMGVVELGMNHPGEIGYLSRLASPTVALVNNAQREHLEFMETVEAVARENGSVLSALGSDGIAVFPADDDYSSIWRELAGPRTTMTFALAREADCTATSQWLGEHWRVSARTPSGNVVFSLSVAGQHNVKNALAAMACALAAGVPLQAIAEGLTAFVPVSGRSRSIRLQLPGRVLTMVDDSYNSNPDSMKAAIDVLAGLPGPRLLVMGDMGEVGNDGPHFHREAGAYARAQGIEGLFTLGTQSERAAGAFGSARHFGGIDELNAAVLAELPYRNSVLIKGSRFMKMERVVHAIADQIKAKIPEEPHAA
jgi:UDP-N-acetylmuramoyl-tripeptide--D-alanyl-D-alanine ligase